MNSVRLVMWICLAVIAAVFIFGWFYTSKAIKNKELTKKKRTIESLPSIVSTLGVIGTFLGITIGLIGFNPSDLDSSISNLLDGLKTAFFTSLAGLAGSLILRSFKTDLSFDQEDQGITSEEAAAIEICKEIKELNKTMSKLPEAFEGQLSAMRDSLILHQDQINNTLSNTKKSLEDGITEIIEITTASRTSLATVADKISNINREVNDVKTMVSEVAESGSALVSGNEELLKETQNYSKVLKGEVVEIEEKMGETNKLLVAKFDEFSELLKKSNTESLVEVMKKVTEEFQKQMSDLINRLVQENFEQLNKSVEQLNEWQKENKEMITALTEQYKEMDEEFKGTSQTLSNVSSDTRQLVSDGGKLSVLINQLNRVMIDDERFVQMTNNLTEAASINKTATEEFKEETNALNEWVRKQRNFVEGVKVLLEKLQEISDLKDYGSQFWNNTRQGMEDCVNILRQGSDTLNSELENLDSQFYERLNATLSELDTCIQAMVNGQTNRRF